MVITSYICVISTEAENINITNLWLLQPQQELLKSKRSFLSHVKFLSKACPVNGDSEDVNSIALGLHPELLMQKYVSVLVVHGTELSKFVFLKYTVPHLGFTNKM